MHQLRDRVVKPETTPKNTPMTTTDIRRRLSIISSMSCRSMVLLLTAFLLSSCGHKGKLDGTYSSSVQSYTFKGETVSTSVMGSKVGVNWPYRVEGKKVILTGPGGDLVLTMNDDGSLSDPAKDKLVKK